MTAIATKLLPTEVKCCIKIMFHYNMFHFFYNGVLYDASRPLIFDIECGPYKFFLIYMILPVIIMSPKLRQ